MTAVLWEVKVNAVSTHGMGLAKGMAVWSPGEDGYPQRRRVQEGQPIAEVLVLLDKEARAEESKT